MINDSFLNIRYLFAHQTIIIIIIIKRRTRTPFFFLVYCFAIFNSSIHMPNVKQRKENSNEYELSLSLYYLFFWGVAIV
ncbi:MAG: hypothetical protein JOS17DRAFT_425139 [Linnemannia elongata]|nr:MAG: hypothetical protein JOS17DRAFT_425139 [Linnemannia elongata]